MNTGPVHRFGDNVNTDDVIAGKYKHRTIDLDELSVHIMENIRPSFANEVRAGDFIVAGENFGCGSSREQAPAVIRHVGVTAVVAKSFARIFFRNAVNIGLVLVETNTDRIEQGDEIRWDNAAGEIVDAQGVRRTAVAYDPEIQKFVDAGGLLAYVKANGGLQ